MCSTKYIFNINRLIHKTTEKHFENSSNIKKKKKKTGNYEEISSAF